jgi:hypothetical protein
MQVVPYPHPQLVNYLLDLYFGAHGSNMVTFQARSGEPCSALHDCIAIGQLALLSGMGGTGAIVCMVLTLCWTTPQLTC